MSVLENGMLVGESVILRPITVMDTDNIIKWRNSEDVRQFFIYQKPFTRKRHLEWLRTMIKPGNGFQFIICEKDTMRPIGSAYHRDYSREHNRLEYGVFIGEKTCIGKGLGKQCSRLMARFAFEELGVHKIFCRVFAENMPSIVSSEHVGFEREAYLKDEVLIDGVYRDMVLLARINPAHKTNL